MKETIDINSLLAPIPGENPAGEDLRYTPIYDALKEARRADDLLERGDWQREQKTSDWGRVVSLAADALSHKSKDLQVAVWLMEALIREEGFNGLARALEILVGLLKEYWEQVYPLVEEEELDSRAAPLEFMNDRLSSVLKQISLTDTGAGPGYSYLQWEESREVGYESNLTNRYGEVDENKKKKRDDLIAEGKLTAEAFDSAVTRTSKTYYESLLKELTVSRDTFKELDALVDEKFGGQAPRLSDLGTALEDCMRAVMKIYKEQKGGMVPSTEPGLATERKAVQPQPREEAKTTANESPPLSGPRAVSLPAASLAPMPAGEFGYGDSFEKRLLDEASQTLKTSGIRDALAKLLEASNSAPSIRARTRLRLLMARMCLETDRPDLARPIMEDLNRVVEELHLERWESPLWIAEVLDALYQCLTRGHPTDEDLSRGKALLERLCTTDVTKAMVYKS